VTSGSPKPKRVHARNRWFKSTFLQRRESTKHRFLPDFIPLGAGQAADALLRAVGRSARHPAAMAGHARARQAKLIFMMLPLRLSPRKRANVMEYRGEPFAVLNRILASSPKRPDRAHRGCERQGSENYSLTSP